MCFVCTVKVAELPPFPTTVIAWVVCFDIDILATKLWLTDGDWDDTEGLFEEETCFLAWDALLECVSVFVSTAFSWGTSLSFKVLRMTFLPSSLVIVSVTSSWFELATGVIFTGNSLVVVLPELSFTFTFNV